MCNCVEKLDYLILGGKKLEINFPLALFHKAHLLHPFYNDMNSKGCKVT